MILVDVWAKHVEQIRRNGLIVEGAGTGTIGPMTQTTDPAALAGAEAVLVLVKAFSNEAAGAMLADALGPAAIVVTLQNGIGNDAVLARPLGPSGSCRARPRSRRRCAVPDG